MAAKIFIPFQNYKSVGGPSTFMRNLKAYLNAVEFPYTETPQNARQIFFPVSFSEDVVKKIKKNKGIVIQRLDGIYYPSKHGEQYMQLNALIKRIYQQYSDFVVFQSEYSKSQCFHMFGEIPAERYALIINGVDKNVFYPNSINSQIEDKVKFITTGNFRNIDMIEPVVQALDTLENQLDFELTVVGPVTNKDLENHFQRSYIRYLGSKNLTEIADILRKQNIYLYSHLNPPCPNSVLEAISCGLPVVGFNSGAMSELLFFSKGLLAEVSGELFQQYKDFHYQKLQDKIVLAIEEYAYWKENALVHSHLYSFEACGRQYVDVFTKMTANLEDTQDKSFLEKVKNFLLMNY